MFESRERNISIFLTQLSHNIFMVYTDKILENVSKRINEIRKDKGWTIQEFSDFVQIPRTTINSWLLKKRLPKIDLLYQIADCFGYSIDYLVGREI